MRDWFVIVIGIGFLFAIIPNIYAQESIPSPLKQIKSGVLPQDVKCYEGFVLIIKVNGDPACVRPQTAQKLVERGWSKVSYETLLPIGIVNASNLPKPVVNTTNLESPKVGGGNLEPCPSGQYFDNGICKNMTNSTNSTNNSNGTTILLPPGISKPTISSTEPNSIKIISIGMLPNPLKIGDHPQFSLSWQNISNKIIYYNEGCTIAPLGIAISPSDNVQGVITKGLMCDNQFHIPVYPGQIITNDAALDLAYPRNTYDPYQLFPPGGYTIMKSGPLNMTMTLKVLKDAPDSYDLVNTIHFVVNATNSLNGTLSGYVYVCCGPTNVPNSVDPSSNFEVDVYSSNGTTLVGKTFSDTKDHYSIQLPEEKYVIYTLKIMQRVPNYISITSGGNSTFDIANDNGFR